MRRSPITAAAVIATAMTGTHQGTPRGPISVKGKIAANATSTLMIGTWGQQRRETGTCMRGDAARRSDPRRHSEGRVSLLAR